MLHNLAHIELNAVDLAWDTVARYSHLNLPPIFYEVCACSRRSCALPKAACSRASTDQHILLWYGFVMLVSALKW